ncbi:hypothetical protein GF325_03320 [Candidatus Bathyarchaeota archaeon]|nr:hypothetical protein [Candidatus Bathyarchaeota archaeon]
MNLKGTLIDTWITGKSSSKVFLTYILVVMGIYATGIVISALVYPGGFSMLDVYVSYLGSDDDNPPGHVIYNICTLMSGLLLIPLFPRMYRKFQPSVKWLNVMASLFGIMGCISFASLGIFFQGLDPTGHQWATILTFAGFGANAILSLPVIIRKNFITRREPSLKQWPRWYHVLPMYAITFGILGLTALADGLPEWFAWMDIDPRFFDDKFLEWIYVFGIISWIVGVAILVM